MGNLIKPIAYLIAMILAFVFTFVTGASGWEGTVIPIVGTITSLVGVTNWRKQFDQFEAYFKSKTIIGSLVTAIPILAIVIVVHIAHVEMAAWLTYVLNGMLVIGGGTFLLGLFDAFYKADPKARLLKKPAYDKSSAGRAA